MHISEQVANELLRTGWNFDDRNCTASKRIEGFANAGQLSNGSRIVTLRLDAQGRYLERIDGWGGVEKDVDLRNYANNPKAAIAAVLA
jgi:hypothetical protein